MNECRSVIEFIAIGTGCGSFGLHHRGGELLFFGRSCPITTTNPLQTKKTEEKEKFRNEFTAPNCTYRAHDARQMEKLNKLCQFQFVYLLFSHFYERQSVSASALNALPSERHSNENGELCANARVSCEECRCFCSGLN